MTQPTDASFACHLMLLRLAGRVPDEMLTRCRYDLAAGRLAELAAEVAEEAYYADLPMPPDDIALLGELLSAAGHDVRVLDEIDLVEDEPRTPYWFTAEPPEEVAEPAVDLAGRMGWVAISVASQQSGVRSLWRAWRIPLDADAAFARPVFLVEADAGENLPATTAALQAALTTAGDTHPQVEVVPVGGEAAAYQRVALGYAALQWARTPSAPLRLARLFDEVDPGTGPRFADDHPRIADPRETARILDYLAGGQALLLTTSRMPDVVLAQPAATVPLNFRTDGSFIWSDASAYYLQRHGFAPDPELLAHIRDGDYRPPPVDLATIQRAISFLQQPLDEEPAWTFDVTV